MDRDHVKVRDLPPTSLRLPTELRERLQREAFINQRALHAEILVRLQASFGIPDLNARAAAIRRASEGGDEAQDVNHNHKLAPPLGDTQRLLLSYFAALPPDKQLALITFLRR